MKSEKFKKRLVKVVLILFVASLLQGISLHHPTKLDSANLTSASTTLGNSRLSYRAGVTTGAVNTSHVTIDTTGNPDNDTDHLFPKDSVCFSPSTLIGCVDNKTYTVSNIVDGDEFNITDDLGTALTSTDLVIATQSGSLTIAFTTASLIPNGGDILITIPMADSINGNDGFPDTAAALANGGFDLNSIAAGDISVSGCSWNATETISVGSGTTDHTIRIDTSASCAASTALTVTIDNAPGIVNPAPITTGHTQGTADVYTINVKTRDGSDSTLDEIDIKVAPIEAVLVSATIDETLSFVVSASASASTACGVTSDVTTTVTSIPWGTLATADSFSEAIQSLTVATNADGGYTLKIEENDQMGKDGVTCTGGSADEASNCIKDTVCGATACTESAARDWTSATYNGLGFSLADLTGSDAVFDYDGKAAETTCTSGTFCARQIADQEATETKASIMSASGPSNSSRVNICYRISISSTQPAGYYYNKVKYTATATF